MAMASNGANMNETLWSRLPGHLIELVFARLPLQSIVRLRSVNKFWHSFVLSEEFAGLQQAVVEFSHKMCIVAIGETGASLKIWLVDSAATSVAQLDDFQLPDYASNPIFNGEITVASHRGLMAVYVRSDRLHSDEIHIGNPVRGIWRKLPLPDLARRPPFYHAIHLFLKVDMTTKQYALKLVIHKSMTTYFSTTGLWDAETENDPARVEHRLVFSQEEGLIQIYDDGFEVVMTLPCTVEDNFFIFKAWDVSKDTYVNDMAIRGLKKVDTVNKDWRSADLCVTAKVMQNYEFFRFLRCDGDDEDDAKDMVLVGVLRLLVDPTGVDVLQQLLLVYDKAKCKWCSLPKVASSMEFFCINLSERGCMFVPSLTQLP